MRHYYGKKGIEKSKTGEISCLGFYKGEISCVVSNVNRGDIGVGEKIHALRLYLGLSLRAFGEPIGYTGTHILRIEQKAVNPSEQFIQKVCEGLHVNPEYFTGVPGYLMCHKYQI